MTNLWGGLSPNQSQLLSDTKRFNDDLKAKMASGEIPPTGTVKPKEDPSSSGQTDLMQQNMMTLMMMLMMNQMMSAFTPQQSQPPQPPPQQIYQPAQPWYMAPFNYINPMNWPFWG